MKIIRKFFLLLDTQDYGHHTKLTLDSLLSEPVYDGAGASPPPLSHLMSPSCPPPSSVPVRTSVISSNNHSPTQASWRPPPPPSGTPPNLRIQRRKYEEHQKMMLPRGPRQEVEQLCVSLMCQYQHCLSVIPAPPTNHAYQIPPDSLLLATRLLSDSLSRVRLFLSGIDTFNCLSASDRAILYRYNVCSIQILKASLGVDLNRCQNAFPLPYGENLGETEAFHLIRAYELYNELRSLLTDIQVSLCTTLHQIQNYNFYAIFLSK